MLRRMTEELKIVFSAHPLCSSDIFCALPNRKRILKSILGTDLISFHTHIHLAVNDYALELSIAEEEVEIIQA